MIILCNKQMSASQQVMHIGKYLSKQFKGSKILKSSNMCDVYITLLYQSLYTNDSIHEMVLDINITTYQNKIRVNIIEVSPYERTIGFDLFDTNTLLNITDMCKKVYNKIITRVSKAYQDYDFLI